MARGNMILGYGRGAIGDVVFFQRMGTQCARARNPHAHNPRTPAQGYVRGRFAAAVKFYQQCLYSPLTLSYDDRRSAETTYNAFMRHNVRICPTITKFAVDCLGYPVIAPFVLSQGSLSATTPYWQDGSPCAGLPVTTPATLPTTVAELTQILTDSGEFVEGEELTLVLLTSTYSGDIPDLEPLGEGRLLWYIRTLTLSSTDTTTLAAALNCQAIDNDGQLALQFSLSGVATVNSLSSFTLLRSRTTSSDTVHSTQDLVLCPDAVSIYNAQLTDTYKLSVALSWKQGAAVDVEPSAILQGSVAYKRTHQEPEPEGNKIVVDRIEESIEIKADSWESFGGFIIDGDGFPLVFEDEETELQIQLGISITDTDTGTEYFTVIEYTLKAEDAGGMLYPKNSTDVNYVLQLISIDLVYDYGDDLKLWLTDYTHDEPPYEFNIEQIDGFDMHNKSETEDYNLTIRYHTLTIDGTTYELVTS